MEGILFLLGIIILPIYFYKSYTGKSSYHRAGYSAFMTTIILLITALVINLAK